jgi:hypothetical protein
MSEFHFFATVFEISLQFSTSTNQREVKYSQSFVPCPHEY